MSLALVRRTGRRGGLVPAIASALVPGVGQLINGHPRKALGVFAVAAISGAGFLAAIPLVGSLAALVGGATWVYGVADGFFARRRR